MTDVDRKDAPTHRAKIVWTTVAVLTGAAALLWGNVSSAESAAFVAVAVATFVALVVASTRRLDAQAEMSNELQRCVDESDSNAAELRSKDPAALSALLNAFTRMGAIANLSDSVVVRIDQAHAWVRSIANRASGDAAPMVGAPRPPAEVDRVHPMADLLQNALLFIGVIGTFSGLMDALAKEPFVNLIEAMRSGGDLGDALADALSGFHLAFATSLAGYFGYVGASYIRDLDHASEVSLLARLDDFLCRQLPAAVSSTEGLPLVDFPDATKKLLEGTSLLDATASVKAAATELALATDASRHATEANVEALSKARDEWIKAVDHYRSGAEQLQVELDKATKSVREAGQSLKESVGTLESSTKEVTTLFEGISQASKKATNQIEVSIREGVQAMTKEVGQALLENANLLQTHHEELRKQIDSHSVIREDLEKVRVDLRKRLELMVDVELTKSAYQEVADARIAKLTKVGGDALDNLQKDIRKLVDAVTPAIGSIRDLDAGLRESGLPTELKGLREVLDRAITSEVAE